MESQRKNYWLYIIIGLLLLGVAMIAASLTIALKNPVQDENTFFASKREVDEHINDIIKAQNHFLSAYKPTFFVIDSQGERELVGFIFPYMAKPHATGKAASKDKHAPLESHLRLALTLTPNTSQSPAIHSITLHLDSPIKSGALRDLGALSPAQGADSEHFISSALSLPHGRWKLIVEIVFDKGQKAYFEREIFIS